MALYFPTALKSEKKEAHPFSTLWSGAAVRGLTALNWMAAYLLG